MVEVNIFLKRNVFKIKKKNFMYMRNIKITPG